MAGEALVKAGGRPGLTKQLRVIFGRHNIEQQAQGLQAPEWSVWLQQNGFKLGPDNLVTPLDDTDVDALIRRHSIL